MNNEESNDKKYSFIGTDFGTNGYELTLFRDFDMLLLTASAEHGASCDNIVRASILTSIGVKVGINDEHILSTFKDEIGIIGRWDGNSHLYFIAVSDDIASLLKANAEAVNQYCAGFIGYKLMQFLGIPVNLGANK